MSNPKMLFKLSVNHSRLNSIVYFNTYRLILTCGFDNKVNIY